MNKDQRKMEETNKILNSELEVNPSDLQVEDSSVLPVPEHPSSLMKKIKNKLIGVESIDFNKAIPLANDSYLLSKYGHTHAPSERLDDFLKDLGTKIKEKNDKAQYVCVMKVPEDLSVFIPGIIGLFKEKGYAVANLKECVANVSLDYIFICWDKFDSQREKSENNI